MRVTSPRFRGFKSHPWHHYKHNCRGKSNKYKSTKLTTSDRGKIMSNPEVASYTCPHCNWTIKTPFGAEDNADHIKLHTEKHHSKPSTEHAHFRVIKVNK